MIKGEGQRVRILHVLQLLWEQSDEEHPITASEFLRRLEEKGIRCERKTIYSDLKDLEEFGFDVIRTQKGAYIGKRDFELPELKLLADAVQSSKFITEKKSDELIDKLSLLLSSEERRQLKSRVMVRNRVKNMNESIYYNVDAINEAIQSDNQIQFVYWNWNVKKETMLKQEGEPYVISPWVLMWENEKYYMVGYDNEEQKLKHFRVDKMLRIEVLCEKRQGKTVFGEIDLSSYGIENFGMFQGERETVTLYGNNELASVLIDRFGKDIWLHQRDEKHFTAVVDVVVSNQFFGWITGLGGKVQIEGPQWVVDSFAELLGQFHI
ncbi:MAG: WYL domain-containing transcriptional regulator [Lachnospiraceae bacterium]|nr:WYL domain-containing transcriptional regulator [Lachnospiraceae bacterium]